MAKPNNSISKIKDISGADHEIIPHRVSDGVYVGALPDISADEKAVVYSGAKYEFPPIPEGDDTYSLVTEVWGENAVTFFVIK